MSTPMPKFHFPTPYGVFVEVSRNLEVSEDHDQAFLFSIEGAAMLAGIHDPGLRERYVQAVKTSVRSGDPGGSWQSDLLASFGGHPVPRYPLPMPAEQLGAGLPNERGGHTVTGLSLQEAVEHLGEGVLAIPYWHMRAEHLTALFIRQLQHWPTASEKFKGVGIAKILASLLEQIGEREIDCLEAAAFYALTDHKEWQVAGESWLRPFRHTWLADWVESRSRFRKLARLVSLHRPVPSWLQKAERAA